MNFPEAKFSENYLTSDFHTNTVISRLVCLLVKMASKTVIRSIVDKKGGTDADVRLWIGKARAVFHQLKNVWGSTDLGTDTKARIFNTIVKPVTGNPDIHQHLPQKNSQDSLARHHPQPRTVATNDAAAGR